MSAVATKYVLGDYTFDNIDDYWLAQHDLKKIDIIRKELDLNDPEVASRLYGMIRDGSIIFDSPLGEEFSEKITDVMANNTKGLLADRKTVDTASGKAKKFLFLGSSIAGLAIALGIFFGSTQIKDMITTRELERVARQTRLAVENTENRMRIAENNESLFAIAANTNETSDDDFNKVAAVEESMLTMLPEFETIYEINPDVVGWLKIPGVNVDYPVFQNKYDPEYYLYRDMKKNEDDNGSLFMDYRCDFVNPTENTIIYGHNMKNGMMFGDLKKYLDRDFFNANKTFSFNTLYEEKQYEIVAVCLTQVSNVEDKNFRYYDFTDATNRAQWDAFIENINSLSVYSADVDLDPSDQVLTLSTCNSFTEDGRLFLVAKRI